MTSNIYKNVLFIDEQVPQHDIFKDACKDDTLAVIYNRDTTRVDTLLMLREKFSTENGGVGIERVGFVFHGTYSAPAMFLNSSALFDTSSPDAINENTQFLIEMIKEFGVKNMDFLACNTLRFQEWKDFYALLLAETGVKVGASDDETGNMKYGGDWVMESTNEDVETVYFTNVIDGYKYLLNLNSSTSFFVNNGELYFSGRNDIFTGLNFDLTIFNQSDITDVSQVSCGKDHTIILKTNGKIYSAGDNTYGQLGLGHYLDGIIFTEVPYISDVVSITCGSTFTFVIKTDGTLWGCGNNGNGQLGLGDTTSRNVFTQVSGITNVKQISCGQSYTLLIKTDGTLWGCGNNGNGQLGLGDTTSRNVFTQVSGITNAKQISCGSAHSVLLKTDGTLWGCGYNSYNQLPSSSLNIFTQYSDINNISYIECGESNVFVIKTDGTLWGIGENASGSLGINSWHLSTFTQITNMSNIAKISCNKFDGNLRNSVIVKTDGTIWVTGKNSIGALGTGNKTDLNVFTQITGFNNVAQIGVGSYHTIISKTDGTLWGCGSNTDGKLGFQTNQFIKPHNLNIKNVKKITNTGIILKTDGTLWGCGYNSYGQLGLGDTTDRTSLTQLTTNVSQVSCGYSNTMIIKNDGTLWGCGYNGYGQLGLGDTTIRNVFTQIMTNVSQIQCEYGHTMIIKNDGTLWGCGYNNYSQLGLGDYTNRNTFTQVPGITNAKQITCGNSSTFLIKTDGTLWSCGRNQDYGQLGFGDTSNRGTFTQVPGITNVSQVSSGYFHTMIIKTDGTLWGCGYNGYGQLGLGDTTDRNIFTQVPGLTNIEYVSCNENSTIIKKKYGSSCFSCGNNYNGTLCLGDNANRNVFTEITLLNKVSLINEMYKSSLLLTGLSGQSINSTGSYSELTDFALNASAASKKLTISNFSLIPLPAEFNLPGKNVVSYQLTDGTNTETVEYIM